MKYIFFVSSMAIWLNNQIMVEFSTGARQAPPSARQEFCYCSINVLSASLEKSLATAIYSKE